MKCRQKIYQEQKRETKRTLRNRIMKIIEKNPGIYFSRIKKLSGNKTGSVHYHIRVLERRKKIIYRRIGNRKLFWGKGYKGIRRESHLPNIHSEIIGELKKHKEGLPICVIADKLDTSHSRICYHMNKLKAKKIVKKKKEGRKTICFLI